MVRRLIEFGDSCSAKLDRIGDERRLHNLSIRQSNTGHLSDTLIVALELLLAAHKGQPEQGRFRLWKNVISASRGKR